VDGVIVYSVMALIMLVVCRALISTIITMQQTSSPHKWSLDTGINFQVVSTTREKVNKSGRSYIYYLIIKSEDGRYKFKEDVTKGVYKSAKKGDPRGPYSVAYYNGWPKTKILGKVSDSSVEEILTRSKKNEIFILISFIIMFIIFAVAFIYVLSKTTVV
jgi:hypothetical protein